MCVKFWIIQQIQTEAVWQLQTSTTVCVFGLQFLCILLWPFGHLHTLFARNQVMDTAKRYLRHFCNFEKLGFPTEKHCSHRLCLTANQLPTAKATGSSWCMVCIEPIDSERVQPSNRKCKLEGNNKQFKTKTKLSKLWHFWKARILKTAFCWLLLYHLRYQLKIWCAYSWHLALPILSVST